MINRVLRNTLIAIAGFLGIGLAATLVVAQPTIAEMKLLFHDTYVKLVYDANPSNAAYTEVLEIDGVDAVVAVTGDL